MSVHYRKNLILTLLGLFLTNLSFAKEWTFGFQTYPPFTWEEGNKLKGGMMDSVKAICQKLKNKCTFINLPLARGVKMVEDGEIDGFLGLLPNPERLVYANFSPTIIVSDLAYLARKGTSKLSGIQDLAGWEVGALRGSASSKMAANHKEAVKKMTVTEEKDSETMVKKLLSNRYGSNGAVIGSIDVMNYWARKEQKTELEPILSIESNQFGVMFSKKKFNKEDFESFSKTTEILKKAGIIDKILIPYSFKNYK